MSVFEGVSSHDSQAAGCMLAYALPCHSKGKHENVRDSASRNHCSILQNDVVYCYKEANRRSSVQDSRSHVERSVVFASVNNMPRSQRIMCAGVSRGTYLAGTHKPSTPIQVQKTGVVSVMYNGITQGHPGQILTATISPSFFKKGRSAEVCTTTNPYARTTPVMRPQPAIHSFKDAEEVITRRITACENKEPEALDTKKLMLQWSREQHQEFKEMVTSIKKLRTGGDVSKVMEWVWCILKLPADDMLNQTTVKKVYLMSLLYYQTNHKIVTDHISTLISVIKDHKLQESIVIGTLLSEAIPGKPVQILLAA